MHRFVVVGKDAMNDIFSGDGEWEGRIKQITNKVDYISDQLRDIAKHMKDSQKKVDKIDKEMGEFSKEMTAFSQRFERQDYLITEHILNQYNQNRNDTSVYDVN